MARKENLTAYHLIDDETHSYGHHEESPWDTDHRGNGAFYDRITWSRYVKSTNTKYPTFRRRNLTEEVSGVLTFEGTYQISSGDGFYFGFLGDKGDEKEAFVLRQCGDKMYAADKAIYKVDNNWHYVKLIIDIDKAEVKVHLDAKYITTVPFTGSAKTICRFQYGYEKESLGEATFHFCMKLYKNYLFHDYGLTKLACFVPEEYTVEKNGKATLTRRPYREGSKYIVYELKGQTASKTSITRSFNRTGGVVGYEMKYYLPKEGGKFTVSLTNAAKEVISIYDELREICCKDGALRAHSKNVWQTLRIEADTDTKAALIRLNGKVVTTIAFDNDADFIDGVKLSFVCEKAATLMYTDLKAFPIPPYPADYVPEPVLPKKKGEYYIGMNICSLWREGSMYGWDCISAFDTNKPLLGFYDEGIPETADWEIKWMSEHGLDFQLYCWYSSESNMPLCKTWLSSEIVDGHMLARYSDKVKIALLWETSCAPPKTFEDFKNYLVPYWIDYFFSDPRYMQIDGQAVMSIYNIKTIADSLGSEELCKKCLDYLRKEVKKLGYKGMIILGCDSCYSKPLYKNCGLDAIHCYSWAQKGYDVEYTKKRMLDNIKEGSIHQVPCVSMGYNLVAWAARRTPVLEPDDMVTLLEWCKNELLDKYPDKNSWKAKLCMLSTWNEYGEGTYMMPAGVHGFGYLDALRKVFYQETPHADIVPNKDQLDRVCILYPQDRQMLAPLHLYDEEKKNDPKFYPLLKKYEFKTQKDLDKWEIHQLTSYEIKDGKLVGHSEQDDPYMILHDEEFLPISTEKIGRIVVNIRTAKPDGTLCAIRQFYKKQDGTWSGPIDLNTNPSKIVPLTIDPATIKDYWHDTICAYRLDPIWAHGDFELESVEIYEAAPHKVFRINDKAVDMSDAPYEENGVWYLPFDTKSQLKHIDNMYYEWSKPQQTLTIYGEKTLVLTKDSDTALLDGEEIKLTRDLKFHDGIPHIELELFCNVLGKTLKITDGDILIN